MALDGQLEANLSLNRPPRTFFKVQKEKMWQSNNSVDTSSMSSASNNRSAWNTFTGGNGGWGGGRGGQGGGHRRGWGGFKQNSSPTGTERSVRTVDSSMVSGRSFLRAGRATPSLSNYNNITTSGSRVKVSMVSDLLLLCTVVSWRVYVFC